jgi:hypothetical protein
MSWLRARGLTRWLATPVDRPVGIQVVHTVAPVEASADRRTQARIADIDRQLAAILVVPAPVRPESMWWQLDRLLDLRNAVCPLPPLPDDYASRPRS